MYNYEQYFKAEKYESVFFIAIGLIAIALSIYFWRSLQVPFYKGAAIPMTVVALIQLTVGMTIFVRSPKDIERVEKIIATEKTRIQTEELPRMDLVMKSFATYKYIEIALIVAGALLFFVLKDDFWKGVGVGLLVQAGLMLALDFVAESRGSQYIQYLKQL